MRRNAPGYSMPEQDYRGGRKVTGPGTTTSDSVPAALSKDEFVIKAKSAKKIGYKALHHMNRTGEIPMRMTLSKSKRIPGGSPGRMKLQFGGKTRQQQLDDQERIASGETDDTPEPAAMSAPAPGNSSLTSDQMNERAIKDMRQGVVPGMAESLKIRFGPKKYRTPMRGGGRSGLSGYASGGKHPGFKAVAAKIGKQPGIRNPGAVLAAASRGASPAAKRANPRLNRVK